MASLKSSMKKMTALLLPRNFVAKQLEARRNFKPVCQGNCFWFLAGR
jgi:hypothetical protein